MDDPSFRGATGCRGRSRTSTRTLASAHRCRIANPPLEWSTLVGPAAVRTGVMQSLSVYPHPRDKRACLPRFHHPTVLSTLIASDQQDEIRQNAPNGQNNSIKYCKYWKYFNKLRNIVENIQNTNRVWPPN